MRWQKPISFDNRTRWCTAHHSTTFSKDTTIVSSTLSLTLSLSLFLLETISLLSFYCMPFGTFNIHFLQSPLIILSLPTDNTVGDNNNCMEGIGHSSLPSSTSPHPPSDRLAFLKGHHHYKLQFSTVSLSLSFSAHIDKSSFCFLLVILLYATIVLFINFSHFFNLSLLIVCSSDLCHF